jgi:hypothetical protein
MTTVAKTREQTIKAMTAIMEFFDSPVVRPQEVTDAMRGKGLTFTAVRNAIWQLVEDGKLEFVEGWRLRKRDSDCCL